MSKKRPPAGTVCFLCGLEIRYEHAASRGHIVPRQFAPEAMRQAEQIELPREWSHSDCDGGFKDDEEYFFAGLYPLVATNNPEFGQQMLADIRRRAEKPQMRSRIREVLKDSGPVTKGGILLPRNVVVWSLDDHKLQRVALKTAQGLLFSQHKRHFAPGQCFDLRLCETDADVPELYQLMAHGIPGSIVHSDVFTSWQFFVPGEQVHLVAMLFWNAILYCAGFTDSPGQAHPRGRQAG